MFLMGTLSESSRTDLNGFPIAPPELDLVRTGNGGRGSPIRGI